MQKMKKNKQRLKITYQGGKSKMRNMRKKKKKRLKSIQRQQRVQKHRLNLGNTSKVMQTGQLWIEMTRGLTDRI